MSPRNTFLALTLFLTIPVATSAQTAPRVTGKENATNAQITINQIDTSSYPKVTMFATVLKNNEPASGLTAADFRIREDEVDQEPITVEPRLTPLQAVVTLDTSGSISKALPAVKEAAAKFLDILAPNDQFQVVGFAREAKTLTDAQANKDTAKAAIRATVARGDTALYDAVYKSVELVKDKVGRKAIVLLSDGVDDNGQGQQLSKHSVDEALALAKEVNVPIFTIGLGSEVDDALLGKIASSTGAAYFKAPAPSDLEGLYASLGRQLSGQYNLFYTSNLPSDGSVHRIQLAYGDLKSQKEFQAPKVVSTTTVAAVTKPADVVAQPVPVAAPKTGEPKFVCEALKADQAPGVKLIGVDEPGGKPVEVGGWEVFKNEIDAESRSNSVHSTGSSSPTVRLEAGSYVVAASTGYVTSTRKIELEANKLCTAEVLLQPRGEIKLVAVSAAGGEALNVDGWQLYKGEADGFGERRELNSTGSETPRYTLAPGSYFAKTKKGFVEGSVNITVNSRDMKKVEVIMPAMAQVMLVAVTSAGGAPLSGLGWDVWKAEANAFGERERILSTGSDSPRLTLPPGKYIAEATKQKVNGQVTFEVTGGQQQKVEVLLNPAQAAP